MKKEQTVNQTLIQPLKWWGGKHYLAKKIIDLMPRHLHYVEPYAGGLAVFARKDRSTSPSIGARRATSRASARWSTTSHRELTNFWRVLQREDTFAAFARQIEAMPFSQFEWEEAEVRQDPLADLDVEAAMAFFRPLSAKPRWWIQGFCHPQPKPHPSPNERTGVGVAKLH